MLAHSLCLQTIVETDKNEEVSQIVDKVDSLKAVNEKHLLIKVFSALNTTLLHNKSINFNVYIFHELAIGGKFDFGKNVDVERSAPFICTDGKSKIISLCPTLGQMYVKLQTGICPSTCQSPVGKVLPVSFIGPFPYIKYTKPIGGSDFMVMKIFALKFGFRPTFHPERSYPAMIINVWNYIYIDMKRNSLDFPIRFRRGKRK